MADDEENAVAHVICEKERTDDVRLKSIPFSQMQIDAKVQIGLQQAGYKYPTVIQAAAIPLGVNKIDLMVQSKSGTGKTLIFTTIILNAVRRMRFPQAIIISPVREIAMQNTMVLNKIGCALDNFKAINAVGGFDVKTDRINMQNAQVVSGTPGRLRHLIETDKMNTSKVKILVLDEADKLFESNNKSMHIIRKGLPKKLQIIACSATFQNNLDEKLSKVMKNPLLVSATDENAMLIGIKQFVYELPAEPTSILLMEAKCKALQHIFQTFTFKQCLIFVNTTSLADSYCNYLSKMQWDAGACAAAHGMESRMRLFSKFRRNKIKIITATDLYARGLDSKTLDLVINIDMPTDVTTYLHRVGRAGRFGSHGIAISFVSTESDRKILSSFMQGFFKKMPILKFPPEGDKRCKVNFWDFEHPIGDCKWFGVFEPLEATAACVDSQTLTTQQQAQQNANAQNSLEDNASSIDIKTFQVNQDDSCINLMTNDSTQLLPSSNTIDDASSIAADSVRSSLTTDMQCNNIFAEQDLLLNASPLATKQDSLDIFDDYKKATKSEVDEKKDDNDVLDFNNSQFLGDECIDIVETAKATNEVEYAAGNCADVQFLANKSIDSSLEDLYNTTREEGIAPQIDMAFVSNCFMDEDKTLSAETEIYDDFKDYNQFVVEHNEQVKDTLVVSSEMIKIIDELQLENNAVHVTNLNDEKEKVNAAHAVNASAEELKIPTELISNDQKIDSDVGAGAKKLNSSFTHQSKSFFLADYRPNEDSSEYENSITDDISSADEDSCADENSYDDEASCVDFDIPDDFLKFNAGQKQNDETNDDSAMNAEADIQELLLINRHNYDMKDNTSNDAMQTALKNLESKDKEYKSMDDAPSDFNAQQQNQNATNDDSNIADSPKSNAEADLPVLQLINRANYDILDYIVKNNTTTDAKKTDAKSLETENDDSVDDAQSTTYSNSETFEDMSNLHAQNMPTTKHLTSPVQATVQQKFAKLSICMGDSINIASTCANSASERTTTCDDVGVIDRNCYSEGDIPKFDSKSTQTDAEDDDTLSTGTYSIDAGESDENEQTALWIQMFESQRAHIENYVNRNGNA